MPETQPQPATYFDSSQMTDGRLSPFHPDILGETATWQEGSSERRDQTRFPLHISGASGAGSR